MSFPSGFVAWAPPPSLPGASGPLAAGQGGLTAVLLVRAIWAVGPPVTLRVRLPHAAAVRTLEGERPTGHPWDRGGEGRARGWVPEPAGAFKQGPWKMEAGRGQEVTGKGSPDHSERSLEAPSVSPQVGCAPSPPASPPQAVLLRARLCLPSQTGSSDCRVTASPSWGS